MYLQAVNCLIDKTINATKIILAFTVWLTAEQMIHTFNGLIIYVYGMLGK